MILNSFVCQLPLSEPFKCAGLCSFQAVRASMNHTNSRMQQLNPNEPLREQSHAPIEIAWLRVKYADSGDLVETGSMNREG